MSPGQHVFDAMYLSTLPPYIPTIIGSALAFQAIFLSSFWLSPRISRSYTKLNASQQVSWNIHITSTVNAFMDCFFAVELFSDPILLKGDVFTTSPQSSQLYGIVVGYFLWDIGVTLWYTLGLPFLAHAVSCFVVFLFSFAPFLHMYGGSFLFFEVSTTLLNVCWFFDKTGRTGGIPQLICGALLVVTFFCARIVWGFAKSAEFWTLMYKTTVPSFLLMLFGTANVLLNVLNVMWFRLLVRSMRKRFAARGQAHDEKVNAQLADEDEHNIRGKKRS